ncbi:MAG: phosphohydrolase [Planctomycetota bacterium]
MKCPGQDTRKLTVSYHPCPTCGKLVEFFSDELMVKCPACKTEVSKDQAPSCIQWCKAARSCIGPKKYDEIMSQVEEAAEKKVLSKNEEKSD